ncbi:MAG: FtsX-like permease family protein [Bacteroidota bacterium]
MINWFKNSTPSVIGLSISLSVSFLIFWLLSFEFSFDVIHENRDRIFRISMAIKTSDSEDTYATTGAMLGAELMEKYPTVQSYTVFGMYDGDAKLSSGNKLFDGQRIYTVNGEVFNMFSYKLVKGNKQTAFQNRNSMVLTKRLAIKIFGSSSALNQVLKLDDVTYTISGIMEDVPNNSDFHFDALIPNTLQISEEEVLQSYFNLDHYTYVLISEQNNESDLLQDLSHFSSEIFNPMLDKVGAGFHTEFAPKRLDQLHLSEPLLMDMPKGNINNLYILLFLAVLLIILGVSNFLNISVIRSFKTAKKVGVLRAFGVNKLEIKVSFMKDSINIVFLSSLLSLIISVFAINYFEVFQPFRYMPDTARIMIFLSATFIALLLIGALAGIIPVNHMFRSDVAMLLKEERSLISYNSWNQRFLLFVQLFISLGLIAGTVELSRQFNYFQNKHLGFDDKNIIVVKVPSPDDYVHQMRRFKKELNKQSWVEATTLCQIVPGDELEQEIFGISVNGESRESVENYVKVDEGYFDVLRIPIETGRNFNLNSDNNSVIVNKAFLEKYPDITIEETKLGFESTKLIVGLITDYHHLSFHNPIEPLIIGKLNGDDAAGKIMIRTNISNLGNIRQKWEELGIGEPFEYYFLDDHFAEQYSKEENLLWIFMACSLIAISLCCFGLYNILAIMMRSKKRELAIRRVLGSSFLEGYILLSKPFLRLTVITLLVAIPIVYYFIDKWNENFVYPLNVSLLPYMISTTVVAIMISLSIYYHWRRFAKQGISNLMIEE